MGGHVDVPILNAKSRLHPWTARGLFPRRLSSYPGDETGWKLCHFVDLLGSVTG
jgi:hypothetical protein